MTSNQVERWQLRVLPLMRGALVLMAFFFFGASLVQYSQVYRDVSAQPASSFEGLRALEAQSDKAGPPGADAVRFRAMVALERDAMALRYRHVNAVLLLRTWTRYTGFLVGMVLAMTGAFFILGRLRENPTHLAAEGAAAKLDLTTESPGMVLAVLGTLLMVLTIWVRFDVELVDKPVYLLPWGAERVAAAAHPAELPEAAKRLVPKGEDDFPQPSAPKP